MTHNMMRPNQNQSSFSPRRLILAAIVLTFCSSASQAGLVDFEDVGAGLADDSFFNGGPNDSTTPWVSSGVSFDNSFTNFDGGFTAWDGWAYSNVQDNSTAGFGNQYAAFSTTGSAAGFGAGNSRTYAIANTGSAKDANGSVLNFATNASLESIDITNSTYALLALRDGDDGGANFAQQFVDGDFFRLTITGFEGEGATGLETGNIDLDLANYFDSGAADDFILTDWTTVDLSSLGISKSLRFSLDSNVVDVFGSAVFLNTPTHIAVDNLNFVAVPEPGCLGLLVCGSLLSLSRARRRIRD
ncbi:MAG: DUF4465 domain-containing protein [Pirellulaceae bacterium]